MRMNAHTRTLTNERLHCTTNTDTAEKFVSHTHMQDTSREMRKREEIGGRTFLYKKQADRDQLREEMAKRTTHIYVKRVICIRKASNFGGSSVGMWGKKSWSRNTRVAYASSRREQLSNYIFEDGSKRVATKREVDY